MGVTFPNLPFRLLPVLDCSAVVATSLLVQFIGALGDLRGHVDQLPGHGGNAPAAASAAARASALLAAAARVTTWPLTGLQRSNVAPPLAATVRPPINSLTSFIASLQQIDALLRRLLCLAWYMRAVHDDSRNWDSAAFAPGRFPYYSQLSRPIAVWRQMYASHLRCP